MKLKLLKSGFENDIYAIVFDDSTCPAEDFLETVKQNDQSSHKSFVNLLNRHADVGKIKNTQKSRVIKTKENLLEFKTKKGDRLMYFYLPGGKTILTHGFHKGAPESQEYERAERMRDQYLKEVESE